MNPSIGETIIVDFITSSAVTGAATDADETPTIEVLEDATDTAILSPTPVKRTNKTGNYRVSISCMTANGFEAGKSYNVVASATVSSVVGKGVIAAFVMRTTNVDDLPSAVDVALALASESVATAAITGDLVTILTFDGTPYAQSASNLQMDQNATVDLQFDIALNGASLDVSAYTFTLGGYQSNGTIAFTIADGSFGKGGAATGTVTCTITAAHTVTAMRNGRLELRFTNGTKDYRAKWAYLDILTSALP